MLFLLGQSEPSLARVPFSHVEEADMNKSIVGLLGGVAALVSLNGAQAATPREPGALNVRSYAELLEPIPNAVSLLVADDAARARYRPAGVQIAQYHHHHHHHHHQFGGFGFGGIIGGPRVYSAPDYYGEDCYIRRQVIINRWGERVVRRVRVCD